MTGFKEASDWWRGGCEFPRPLTETVKTKKYSRQSEKVYLITFDTQLKIVPISNVVFSDPTLAFNPTIYQILCSC